MEKQITFRLNTETRRRLEAITEMDRHFLHDPCLSKSTTIRHLINQYYNLQMTEEDHKQFG